MNLYNKETKSLTFTETQNKKMSTKGITLSRPGGWLHKEMVYLPADSHPSSC